MTVSLPPAADLTDVYLLPPTQDHTGDVVICLGGVESADLSSLVDYMYSGEVEVARGRLADFLALASQWGVRGLEEEARCDGGMTKVGAAGGRV